MSGYDVKKDSGVNVDESLLISVKERSLEDYKEKIISYTEECQKKYPGEKVFGKIKRQYEEYTYGELIEDALFEATLKMNEEISVIRHRI